MASHPPYDGLSRSAPHSRRGAEVELERLVAAHQGFVSKLAREYSHLGVPLEDLVNEGNVGLLQAARRFDALRGTRFLTYAAAWIRKQILSALEKHARLVRLPAYRMKTLRSMLSAERALTQRLGRTPDREELGEQMHARRGEVERLQSYRFHEVSIDADDAEGQPALAPLADAEALTPEDELLRDETFRLVHGALAVLGARERTVLVERYGLADGQVRTLREVAVALGLSRERVRQIEATARFKIARHLSCSPRRRGR